MYSAFTIAFFKHRMNDIQLIEIEIEQLYQNYINALYKLILSNDTYEIKNALIESCNDYIAESLLYRILANLRNNGFTVTYKSYVKICRKYTDPVHTYVLNITWQYLAQYSKE